MSRVTIYRDNSSRVPNLKARIEMERYYATYTRQISMEMAFLLRINTTLELRIAREQRLSYQQCPLPDLNNYVVAVYHRENRRMSYSRIIRISVVSESILVAVSGKVAAADPLSEIARKRSRRFRGSPSPVLQVRILQARSTDRVNPSTRIHES